jgi:hypothetical protein
MYVTSQVRKIFEHEDGTRINLSLEAVANQTETWWKDRNKLDEAMVCPKPWIPTPVGGSEPMKLCCIVLYPKIQALNPEIQALNPKILDPKLGSQGTMRVRLLAHVS